MDITPLIKGDRKLLNSYGAGRFIVSGVEYGQSIVVTPGEVVPWANGLPFGEASFAFLDALAAPVEILLIGTGKTITPLPPMLRQSLKDRGISIDIMDTGAACRTYNVLLSEERRVAAALAVI